MIERIYLFLTIACRCFYRKNLIKLTKKKSYSPCITHWCIYICLAKHCNTMFLINSIWYVEKSIINVILYYVPIINIGVYSIHSFLNSYLHRNRYVGCLKSQWLKKMFETIIPNMLLYYSGMCSSQMIFKPNINIKH